MLREGERGLRSHTPQELQAELQVSWLEGSSIDILEVDWKILEMWRVFSFQKYERKSFFLLPWKIAFSLNTVLIFPFLKHKPKQLCLVYSPPFIFNIYTIRTSHQLVLLEWRPSCSWTQTQPGIGSRGLGKVTKERKGEKIGIRWIMQRSSQKLPLGRSAQ